MELPGFKMIIAITGNRTLQTKNMNTTMDEMKPTKITPCPFDKNTKIMIIAGVVIVTWIMIFLFVLKNMDKLRRMRKMRGKKGELEEMIEDLYRKREI